MRRGGGLHQRERIWLIAYNPNLHAESRNSGEIYRAEARAEVSERNKIQYFGEPVNLRTNYSDSDFERSQKLYFPEESGIFEERVSRYFGFGPYAHGNFTGDEIKSGIIRMLNGLPEGMDYVDRNQRIKALGNAIVPQMAFEIFQVMQKTIFQ